MAEERHRKAAEALNAKSVEDELASLNSELHDARHRIEAVIDKKSKHRRSDEKPASTGFKKT